ERLLETKEEDRNIFRYIIDHSMSVHELLTNNGKNYDWWRYTARLNVYWFKRDNEQYKNEAWYNNRVNSLKVLPEFTTLWESTDRDTKIEAPQESKISFPEYVTKIFPHGAPPVVVRGLQIRYINYDYP